ncbi:MAG: type II toxin-antitoxin system death-on-curing family toxin [Planctomycetaceae bacterium]|nr:type II toxin-antitoxin system death-on-curing family toxin [Planctomycetaceae bacterium]
MAITFLSLDEVIEIHRNQIALYGGSLELRDLGLLEAAVMVPQQSFGGQFLHDDIPAMAAAYLFHLVKNHPFVDGNKRVGAATANVFLVMNGSRLMCSENDYAELVLGVADSTISKADTTEWFRARAKPREL